MAKSTPQEVFEKLEQLEFKKSDVIGEALCALIGHHYHLRHCHTHRHHLHHCNIIIAFVIVIFVIGEALCALIGLLTIIINL